MRCSVLVSLEAGEVGQMHGRHENDGCFLEARMLPDDLSEFKAVDLRHADIHQYDGNIGFEQFLESVLGRGGLDQVLSQIGEHSLIAEQFASLIVDHENVHCLVCGHHSLRNAPYDSPPLPRVRPPPPPYLCSPIRSAESNCSVLTGLAKYSDAPASRHFSRSPFIALAVRAMMGRRRNIGFCRMTCMVS